MRTDALKRAQKRYSQTEKGKRAIKRWHLKEKQEVLKHYGGGKQACVACGESDSSCLSIDHIKAIGARRMNPGYFYHWLIKNNYPEGYQTLCMNCQWKKRALNKEYSHS